jgi:CheY-like chemotaxis protein
MARPISFTRRRSGSVLLVDDYDEARATIREALEARGHEVIEARNGKEALDLLVAERATMVGMIVLDLQMPIMDGWQFLGLLGTYLGLANIPVLIVSGHPVHLDRLTHQAIVGCLHPPYPLDELVKLVNLYNTPVTPHSAPQQSSG